MKREKIQLNNVPDMQEIDSPSFLKSRRTTLLETLNLLYGGFNDNWFNMTESQLQVMVDNKEKSHDVLVLPRQTLNKLELLSSPALTPSELLILMVEKEYLKRVKATERRLEKQRRLVKSLEWQVRQLREVNNG